MTGTFTRGLIAGAAGTTALHAVTYLDMAVRGRPASTLPEETVDALAAAAGTTIPGGKADRAHRRTGLGALAGITGGLGVGVLGSVVRAAGLRLPRPIGAVVTGAAALAATDGPAVALGVTDPRTWSSSDWVSDAVPHLVYGAVTSSVIAGLPTPAETARPLRRAGAGLTLRAALLGAATGGRSSLGVGGPTLTTASTSTGKRLAAVAAIAGELALDKQPDAPARTSAAGLPPRLAAAASGAGLLARREGANSAWPVAAGLAGATAASWGGLGWRRWADGRMPDWQAGVLEDGVALLLAALACLPGRRRTPRPAVVPPPRPLTLTR